MKKFLLLFLLLGNVVFASNPFEDLEKVFDDAINGDKNKVREICEAKRKKDYSDYKIAQVNEVFNTCTFKKGTKRVSCMYTQDDDGEIVWEFCNIENPN